MIIMIKVPPLGPPTPRNKSMWVDYYVQDVRQHVKKYTSKENPKVVVVVVWNASVYNNPANQCWMSYIVSNLEQITQIMALAV